MNEDLRTYLEKLFGKSKVYVSDEEKTMTLPLIYKSMYHFFSGTILNEECIFFERRNYDESNLFIEESLNKHIDAIQRKYSEKLIFVVNHLTTKERQILINYQISFIAPYDQVFLPFVYFINQPQKKRAASVKVISKLTPTSQQILFYSLYKYILTFDEIIHKKEIIDQLKISNMTFTRAMNELIQLKIVQKQGFTRNIIYFFLGSPAEIFNKVKAHCINPIKDTRLIEMSNVNQRLINEQLKSGEYALSELTMIKSQKMQIAVSSADMSSHMFESDINEFMMYVELQIWRYDAKPLIRYFNKDRVDPLSLYMSLYEERDERLLKELNYLLQQLFNRELFDKNTVENINQVLEIKENDEL